MQRSQATHPDATLDVACRYYRVYTDPDVPCDEANFGFVQRRLPIPVAQAAVILVDVWATHYIGSWLARAAQVTQEKIAPLLAAARGAGLTVIHAPSPYVVERHHPEALPGRPPPANGGGSPAETGSAWPPPAFRGIYRSGPHAAFGRDPEPRLPVVYARYETELKIAAPAQPQPGEPIIATGQQLHELLAARGMLHLFYAGFATNWCVIGRDYGIIAMNQRGYNIVLVRDATTGVEFHDTAGSLTATAIAIREVETKYAWSTTTVALMEACDQSGPPAAARPGS